MPDDVDLANDQLHSELSRAINRIRKNNSPINKGSKTCIECGEDIPEARRELGLNFCVGCAESKERRRSLFAED